MDLKPRIIRFGNHPIKTGLATTDMKQYMKDYRQTNKEKLKEKHREWYARNSEKEIARVKAAKKKATNTA